MWNDYPDELYISNLIENGFMGKTYTDYKPIKVRYIKGYEKIENEGTKRVKTYHFPFSPNNTDKLKDAFGNNLRITDIKPCRGPIGSKVHFWKVVVE